MESYRTQSQIFRILAHPTRLAIFDALREGEQCVCHMEALFGLRQAHISQHLMVLREAGLVADRRDGWNIFYRVSRPEIFQVIDQMRAFSGTQSQPPFIDVSVPARKRSCPCPKCNPGMDRVACNTPDLSTDKVKLES